MNTNWLLHRNDESLHYPDDKRHSHQLQTASVSTCSLAGQLHFLHWALFYLCLSHPALLLSPTGEKKIKMSTSAELDFNQYSKTVQQLTHPLLFIRGLFIGCCFPHFLFFFFFLKFRTKYWLHEYLFGSGLVVHVWQSITVPEFYLVELRLKFLGFFISQFLNSGAVISFLFLLFLC